MSDRPDRPEQVSRLMRTQRLLTEGETSAFLARMAAENPHLRGAHVADFLDMLKDSDSYLPEIERAYEQQPAAATRARAFGSDLGLLVYCAIYALGDAERWPELLDRIATEEEMT